MLLRQEFRKGLRWIVGNGDKISFWFDNWVFPYPISDVCPVVRDSEDLMVAKFIDMEAQWDSQYLLQFVPEPIVNVIKGIFIPRSSIEDKLIWGLTADGCYSVKSGVALLQGFGICPPSPEPFSWLWKLSIPPKVKFFLWKICNNGLSTKKRLEICHIFVPLECGFCNHHSEDTAHLFIECPFEIDVFNILASSVGWPIPPPLCRGLVHLRSTSLCFLK